MIESSNTALLSVLSDLGISPEEMKDLPISKLIEIKKVLKEEYGIEVVVKAQEEIKKMEESSIPELQYCGTPPDGKARRRERRRLERLQNKKRRLI